MYAFGTSEVRWVPACAGEEANGFYVQIALPGRGGERCAVGSLHPDALTKERL